MVKLQSSMNEYVKWLSRRNEGMDREKGVPAAILGRSMIAHGEDFDNDSEFGNCLIGMLSSRTRRTRTATDNLNSHGPGQRTRSQYTGAVCRRCQLLLA